MKDIYWLKSSATEDGEESPVGGSNDDNNIVSSLNNNIYFYSEVNRVKNLQLNKKLVTLGTSLVNRNNSLGVETVTPINLHINSYGGSLFAGFSSVDYVLNCAVPVHSVIDGCAASAATLFSVVAEKRYMHKHSFMLIHQLSSGMWGNYESLKDDMENCDLLMETVRTIYSEHTKIPKKTLNQILKRDLWFDAETCLKHGLIDEII
jgi:ATP-dependent protease ClpP protease subunit